MKTISIAHGQINNQIISGEFEVVSNFKRYTPAKIRSGYAKEGFDGYAKILMDGQVRRVHMKAPEYTSIDGFESPVVVPQEVSIEELDQKIRRRFQVMDIMCQGVIESNVRGLIISGAPGVGKTFTFERELKEAEETGKIHQFTHIKGKMTPLFLFQQLWENREEGDVILIDDCDNVFGDETSMNLLKSALDTSDERWVTYGSATKYLEDNGIEPHFEFKGSIVFITNYDFDSMIESNSKMTPHLSALVSRSTYLDLAIHNRREIMVRVQQIAKDTTVLSGLGVGPEKAEEMVQFCWDNYNKMREISIRTLLKIASYDQIGDWKMLASELLIK